MVLAGNLSRAKCLPLKVVASTIVTLYVLNLVFGATIRQQYGRLDPINPATSSTTRQCRQLPGADDVLVVVKTGSTELQDKLPVHFGTTFGCYADFVVFSDYEEELDGYHVYDALDQVSEEIRLEHHDFALWRRLKAEGRTSLGSSELSGTSSSSGGVDGKQENPGWRLDKWKFLPMMNKTLSMYPEKKWYVFVEVDTYLVWSNLLQWTAALDANKPIYAGYQMQIENQIFAHGGAGFVVSNPALHLVAEEYAKNKPAWEDYTDKHWAGDCVLGKAFEDAGSRLLWSWPLTVGDSPNVQNFFKSDYYKRMWCYPAVTYHHLSTDEIDSMWHFEQDWIKTHRSPLRQSDVFQRRAFPPMKKRRVEWDNLSGPLGQGRKVSSIDECRELCQAERECKQYRLAVGKCTTSTEIKLGGPAEIDEVHSGWMVDRIEDAIRNAEPCHNTDWITEFGQ